ncbi:hypothetical protein EMEDMD4_1070008 [Sinorhizobium medicae]|uniref:Uncharacterized protein n=1 Tax=Sinorhizobium medicae TaxID=110321 RepID=A0A508WPJ2_9HYPH|nr:hypothetical protein EMEDMD4_1070008 [Sinorhizobium medicae]
MSNPRTQRSPSREEVRQASECMNGDWEEEVAVLTDVPGRRMGRLRFEAVREDMHGFDAKYLPHISTVKNNRCCTAPLQALSYRERVTRAAL